MEYATGDAVEIANDSMSATDGLTVGTVGTVEDHDVTEHGEHVYLVTFSDSEIWLHAWEIKRH